jgi:hypothetical protein
MGGKISIKDESILLLPNKPRPYEEAFHEKIIVKLDRDNPRPDLVDRLVM